MRTSIHWENLEKPVQVVQKKVSVPITFYDWSEVKKSEQKTKLEELKVSDAKENIDLSNSPVFRLFLIKLSKNVHFLLWSCHHILADGWSASIILRDLLAFYDANCKDIDEAELPTIPSYKSYLTWINQQDKTKANDFWSENLKGFKTPTLIGNQVNSNSNQENRFQSAAIEFSYEESEILRNFSQKNQITLNTLIQGFWTILLSRYLDNDDVAFGTIVSGRSIELPNADLMAGMYMKVLPLRVMLDSNEEFSGWLKNLQLQNAKIREFEHINLDEILSLASSLKGRLSFDSLIVFENFPAENISGGGISIGSFKSGLTSNYALTLAINPLKEIKAYLKYDSSSVTPLQINWFTENLKNLIQAIIENKTNSLKDVIKYVTPKVLDKVQDSSTETDNLNSREYTAPRTDVELKLTGIWETLLIQQPIGVTDDFFDIGGTSIIAIRLFAEIEKQFTRKLQPINLLKHRSIESLAKLIADDKKEEKLTSLVPLRASGSKPPIYCLHAGGGQVFFYRELAKYLGEEQPVYAIQRLDMDDLAQANLDIKTMATHYLEEIRKVQPIGPYSFLGYCFSTYVVWEMTRQLLEQGESVSMLAMIDSPPYFIDKRTTDEKMNRILGMLRKFDLSFLKTIWQGKIIFPIKQKWNYLTGGENEKEHQNLMSALNANSQPYVWKPLPVKVTLIRSDWNMKVAAQNEAVKLWDDLAIKDVDTFAVKGLHELLFEMPYVQGLANQLEKCLDKVNG